MSGGPGAARSRDGAAPGHQTGLHWIDSTLPHFFPTGEKPERVKMPAIEEKQTISGDGLVFREPRPNHGRRYP